MTDTSTTWDLVRMLADALGAGDYATTSALVAANPTAAHAAATHIRVSAKSRLDAACKAEKKANRADRIALAVASDRLRRAKAFLAAAQALEQQAMRARGDQRRTENEASARRREGMTYNHNSALIKAVRAHKAATLAADIEPEPHDVELWETVEELVAERHRLSLTESTNNQEGTALHD